MEVIQKMKIYEESGKKESDVPHVYQNMNAPHVYLNMNAPHVYLNMNAPHVYLNMNAPHVYQRSAVTFRSVRQ